MIFSRINNFLNQRDPTPTEQNSCLAVLCDDANGRLASITSNIGLRYYVAVCWQTRGKAVTGNRGVWPPS